jgi:hypothetical protein
MKDSPTTVSSYDWLPERGGFEPPRPLTHPREIPPELAKYSALRQRSWRENIHLQFETTFRRLASRQVDDRLDLLIDP